MSRAQGTGGGGGPLFPPVSNIGLGFLPRVEGPGDPEYRTMPGSTHRANPVVVPLDSILWKTRPEFVDRLTDQAIQTLMNVPTTYTRSSSQKFFDAIGSAIGSVFNRGKPEPDPWGSTHMGKNPSVWLNPTQPKSQVPLTAEHEAIHALWNYFYPRAPISFDPGMYFQYPPETRQILRENYNVNDFEWLTARYNEAPTVSYDLWGRDNVANLPDAAKRWFEPIFQSSYMNP